MSECLRIKMEEYRWSEIGEGTLPRTEATCEVKKVSNSYVKETTLMSMPSAKGYWSFWRRLMTHFNSVLKGKLKVWDRGSSSQDGIITGQRVGIGWVWVGCRGQGKAWWELGQKSMDFLPGWIRAVRGRVSVNISNRLVWRAHGDWSCRGMLWESRCKE